MKNLLVHHLLYPILEKPGVSLAPVNLIDVFPTLCELINISIPKGLAGKSLLPILNDSSNRIRKFSSSIYPRNNYYGIAIRTERYRYVAWYKGWKKKGYMELQGFGRF